MSKIENIIHFVLRSTAAFVLTFVTYVIWMYTFFTTTFESSFKIGFEAVLILFVYWLALYALERLIGGNRKRVPTSNKSLLIAIGGCILAFIAAAIVVTTDIDIAQKIKLSVFAMLSILIIYTIWNLILPFERNKNAKTKKNDPVSNTQ